jgi:N-acetylneuraminic acid mutarotase
MKKILLLLFILHSATFNISFSQGTWTRKADFAGGPRSTAVRFVIGSKAYVGTGSASSTAYFNDLWEYDAIADSWTQKAAMPGPARIGAAAFSIGGKGYVCTGRDTLVNVFYNDLWEYDQPTNSWTQKANFPGTPRMYATGFAISGKGYVGTGDTTSGNSYVNDFWCYDPTLDSWSSVPFPGAARGPAVAVSANIRVYFGTGNDAAGPRNDIWEFDPSGNTWTQKASLPVRKCGAAGFQVNGKVYIGTGEDSSSLNTRDFYQYTVQSNTWIRVADLTGAARRHAAGFNIGSKGYICTGSWNQDLWEYDPNGVGVPENEMHFSCSIFPNPVHDHFTIQFPSLPARGAEFVLYDVNGRIALTSSISRPITTLSSGHLSPGIYLYVIRGEGKAFGSGKLIFE